RPDAAGRPPPPGPPAGGQGLALHDRRAGPQGGTRADGDYLVLPPSVLRGGKAYRWAPGPELDGPPCRLPEPPPWLVEELDRLAAPAHAGADATTAAVGENPIPAGQRNATLARLAGAMRPVGMSRGEMPAALLQVNKDRCAPPLPTAEVERVAASVARYEPDQVSVALAENHYAQMYADHPAEEAGSPDP